MKKDKKESSLQAQIRWLNRKAGQLEGNVEILQLVLQNNNFDLLDKLLDNFEEDDIDSIRYISEISNYSELSNFILNYENKKYGKR